MSIGLEEIILQVYRWFSALFALKVKLGWRGSLHWMQRHGPILRLLLYDLWLRTALCQSARTQVVRTWQRRRHIGIYKRGMVKIAGTRQLLLSLRAVGQMVVQRQLLMTATYILKMYRRWLGFPQRSLDARRRQLVVGDQRVTDGIRGSISVQINIDHLILIWVNIHRSRQEILIRAHLLELIIPGPR